MCEYYLLCTVKQKIETYLERDHEPGCSATLVVRGEGGLTKYSFQIFWSIFRISFGVILYVKKRNPFCVIKYTFTILKEPFAYKIYFKNYPRKSPLDLSNIFCVSACTLTFVEKNVIDYGPFNSSQRDTFYIRSISS